MINLSKEITQRALYYIDIGSGSIIVQFIISFLLSSVVFIKLKWKSIKEKIFKKDNKDSEE